jgi:hypothetical protein
MEGFQMKFSEWLELREAKDACYHKVKEDIENGPVRYASGALVRCRKVGAENWGNKTENSQWMKAFLNWKKRED